MGLASSTQRTPIEPRQKHRVFIYNGDTDEGTLILRFLVNRFQQKQNFSKSVEMICCSCSGAGQSGQLMEMGVRVFPFGPNDQLVNQENIKTLLTDLEIDTVVVIPTLDWKYQQGINMKASCQMMEICRDLGIHRVILTSLIGAHQPDVPLLNAYGMLETFFVSLQLPGGCIVRAGFWSQAILTLRRMVKREKKIRLPVRPESEMAFLDCHDYAHFIATLIAHTKSTYPHIEGSVEKSGYPCYTITGSKSFSAEMIAQSLSSQLQTAIEFEECTMEEFDEYIKGKRMIPGYRQLLKNWLYLMGEGKMSAVTADYHQVVGHDPHSFDAFVKSQGWRFQAKASS